MGWWGNLGSPPQKGIVSYTLSANRQRPLAGAMHAAVFNSWRRFKGQVLYVAPPFIVAYLAMDWAIKEYAPTSPNLLLYCIAKRADGTFRNHFLNSKEGRRLHGEEEE